MLMMVVVVVMMMIIMMMMIILVVVVVVVVMMMMMVVVVAMVVVVVVVAMLMLLILLMILVVAMVVVVVVVMMMRFYTNLRLHHTLIIIRKCFNRRSQMRSNKCHATIHTNSKRVSLDDCYSLEMEDSERATLQSGCRGPSCVNRDVWDCRKITVINPFTATACQISGLNETDAPAISISSGPVTHLLSMICLFMKFLAQVGATIKAQKGLRVSNFALLLVVFS